MEGRGVGAEFNIAYPHTDAFPIGKGGCSSDMFVDQMANFQGPSPVQAGAGLFHLSEGRLGVGWHAEFGQFPRSKRRNHEDGNGEHTKP